MADRPAAEVAIDEPLVRGLLRRQADSVPGAERMPVRHVADGWDCSVWRLGDELAVRMPRRAAAAALIRHEQQHLPGIARRLRDTGVGVPAPIVRGRPAPDYPWPWSVVPWFDGAPGLEIPRAERVGWAPALARALRALHRPAAGPYPANPFRGVPLALRADAVAQRFDRLRATGVIAPDRSRRLRGLWDAALDAAPWHGDPVWIHGDLHPGNIIARASRLVALIDFGDLTAGDPAYDIAAAWMAFDPPGRARFRTALGDAYDAPTWARARGWAVMVGLILVGQSDDNPPYAALGREILDELAPSRGTGDAWTRQGTRLGACSSLNP